MILETKIEQEANSDLLKNRRVIELDFESIDSSSKVFTRYDVSMTAQEVATAIRYQLGERMIFVKPRDALVADLLYTHAIIVGHTGILEHAIEILNLAKEYGFSDPDLLLDTREGFEKTIRRGRWFLALKITAGLAVFAMLTAYSIKRGWLVLERSHITGKA